MKKILLVLILCILSACGRPSSSDGGPMPTGEPWVKPVPPTKPPTNESTPLWREFRPSSFQSEKCVKDELNEEAAGAGLELGETPSSKKQLNILIIRGSRTKNTTVIDVFYNHIKGSTYLDRKAVAKKERGFMGTKQVVKYTAENEDYAVNLIDTPGLTDLVEDPNRAEESAQKIAEAVAHISIHSILVIFSADDVKIASEETVNILRLLPKSISDNMIAVVDRSTLSSPWKESHVQFYENQVENIFWKNKVGQKPKSYFIEGSGFFFHKDGEQDEYYKKRWQKDSQIINGLFNDIAQKNPVSGKEIWKIHRIKQKINVLNAELQSVLSKDLYVNYIRRQISDSSWKPYGKITPEFSGEGKRVYAQTLSSKTACEDEIRKLEEEQKKSLCRMVALETELEKLVMESVRNPYLIYLSSKQGDIKSYSIFDQEGGEFESGAYEYWKQAYDHLIGEKTI